MAATQARQRTPAERAARRRLLARRRLTVCFVLALGLLVAVLAGIYTAEHPAPPTATTPAAPQPAAAAAVVPAVDAAFGTNDVNILLCGTDAGEQAGRTDTIVLLVCDLKANRLGAVSIPRDTRVQLGGRTAKVNAAYETGGKETIAKAVADLTQVPVHHFARIDLAGFERLVDQVGGVDLAVEKRMRYTDRAQNLRIDLQPGQQHLNGNQAMQYVRFRHDAMGDLGRIERQQKFLRALGKQLADPRQLAHLPQALQTINANLDTTLDARQMLRLAQLVRTADLSQVTAAQLPGEAVTERGVSYFVPAPEAAGLAAAIRQQLRTAPARPSAAVAAGPAAVVTIYNGSDRLGLEALASQALQSAGAQVAQAVADPVPAVAKTAVYAVGDGAAAARVAAALGVKPSADPAPATYRPANGTTNVLVVLGSDYPGR